MAETSSCKSGASPWPLTARTGHPSATISRRAPPLVYHPFGRFALRSPPHSTLPAPPHAANRKLRFPPARSLIRDSGQIVCVCLHAFPLSTSLRSILRPALAPFACNSQSEQPLPSRSSPVSLPKACWLRFWSHPPPPHVTNHCLLRQRFAIGGILLSARARDSFDSSSLASGTVSPLPASSISHFGVDRLSLAIHSRFRSLPD